MANLAECWGWMPREMGEMEWPDLMRWHRKALDRRPKEGGK
ncbi:MAG: GpE family phage tail protein [Sphingobium sp.]